jgi:hypothetical protein
MIPGEVKECAHCGGKGIRTQGFSGESCKACVVQTGLDPSVDFRSLICSACGGKGSVWVGPDVLPLLCKEPEFAESSDEPPVAT